MIFLLIVTINIKALNINRALSKDKTIISEFVAEKKVNLKLNAPNFVD